MDRYQFCAIGKGRFDLYVVDHLSDAIHNLFAGNHMRARFHHIGHRAAITGTLDHGI